jgi:SAM-dependent methyltransferase
MDADRDPVYVFGHSPEEQRRLMAQEEYLGASLKQLLREAGVTPGMRVLDIGCGVGDTSFLTARLVGATGSVVGVDRAPEPLTTARERAAVAGMDNVSFVEGDLRELAFDAPFDAAIGRFVLMYQPDPAAAVRSAAHHVRPGGIVAFQEVDVGVGALSFPRCPTQEQCAERIQATYRAGGIHVRMGARLFGVFRDAGLSEPTMRLDARIGGGPDFPGYAHLAWLVRSLLPMIERFGIATAAEVDIETLEDRLRTEAVAGGGVFVSAPFIGAWARKPS